MNKGERTRQAILDAALAEATTVGLQAISIGGLARKTSLSKSGLFAHFGSKEDLQLQILQMAADRFVEEIVAPALRERRGEPRIRALFEGWLVWEGSNALPGGCPFISAANEFDDQPGALRDYLVDSQRKWLGTLARAAQLAVDEGHFHADLDPEQFAYDFYSLFLAYHYFARLLRDPDTEGRCRQSFSRLLARSRRAG
jgi:AcrR family transcriptional regulator